MKQLQAEAAKLGIDTNGKSAKELSAAIHEKRKAVIAIKKAEQLQKLQAQAASLGIDTAGKTSKQLSQEIRAKQKKHKN